MILSAEYSAGLFDGEGTVYAAIRQSRTKWRPSPCVLVCLANTYRPVLDFMQDRWGGSIYGKKRKDRHKEQFQWVLASKMAYPFLLEIAPFVVIKHDVVRVAIELCGLMRLPLAERIDYSNLVERGGRKWVAPIVRPEFHAKTMALHAEIRRLNTRGAPFNVTRKYDVAA